MAAANLTPPMKQLLQETINQLVKVQITYSINYHSEGSRTTSLHGTLWSCNFIYVLTIQGMRNIIIYLYHAHYNQGCIVMEHSFSGSLSSSHLFFCTMSCEFYAWENGTKAARCIEPCHAYVYMCTCHMLVQVLTWCVKFPHLWADLNEKKHLTWSRTKDNLNQRKKKKTTTIIIPRTCTCIQDHTIKHLHHSVCVCVCVCVLTYPCIVDNGTTLDFLSLRPQPWYLSPDCYKL